MKLLILQEKLKQGINIIERISGKFFDLPILNNFLIKTEKNFINLIATDLEISINWWSLAKIEKEGKIVLPNHILSNFINLLPNKQIIFEKKDNNILNIECENIKTQINGLSSEDFPIIPEILKEKFIELDINYFYQGLKQIIDIPIVLQNRPEISGIFFLFQKNIIKIVATNSFVLGEKTLFFQENLNYIKNFPNDISFILPQKTCREIINIFDNKQGKLKIYFSPNQILFETQMIETPHSDIQITSRLIEGEYPNYEEIIPKKYNTQVIVNKNEFLNQIKLANIISGKNNEIKLKIDSKNQKIEIFSQNFELGNFSSTINGKIKGENLNISFNQKFLLDGILNLKDNEIILELNKEEQPGILKSLNDDSYIYIIMPLNSC